jgi:predicted secreted protein
MATLCARAEGTSTMGEPAVAESVAPPADHALATLARFEGKLKTVEVLFMVQYNTCTG